MPIELAKLEQIFGEAAGMPGEERAQFLNRACGENAELRDVVESLLRAHDAAGTFLQPATTINPANQPPAEDVGTVIGRYKLLQKIGEGGFGVVYMAEQEQPIRRRVALKIIKLGMDTGQVIARFEAERQALAILDHPGIAKVHDGGATDAGRPYFVMELVIGVPITEYCDRNRIGIRQRIELFIQVCQAVQHAHQKGLIHRDLKPSNVLVSTVDGRPVAKVIDFGIAKAMAARLTEKTLFTEFRTLIGTPEYMSPEQAEGSLDIDTRSDVYSLGALLYEILAGAPPFDPKELRSKAYGEMQRIIRELEPPRPSTRVSTSANAASIAAVRGIEPRQLRASLHGELDWIVMKCLDKDRTRRYESAAALAGDAQRFLADEPISAAAPTTLYRLRKFVRRNKGPVIVAATISLLLIGGIIGTTLGLVGQSQQRRLAEIRGQEAERQAEVARANHASANAVLQFQLDMFDSAHPDDRRDSVKVIDVMDAAVKQLDDGKFNDNPVIAAAVRYQVGQTYFALGRLVAAETNFRKCVELRREIAAKDVAYNRSLADAIGRLVLTMNDQGRYADAEALISESLTIRRRERAVDHKSVAADLILLSTTLMNQAKLADAEQACHEAATIQRQIVPLPSGELSDCLNALGVARARQGKFADAEAAFREQVEVRRKDLPSEQKQLAQAISNLANVLNEQAKLTEAELCYREALEIRRAILPVDHPDIAQTLNNFGPLLERTGRFDEAESILREAVMIRRKSLGADNPLIASSLANLASLLAGKGDHLQAEALYREALAVQKKNLSDDHPSIAQTLNNLGGELTVLRRFDEAEPMLREALAIRRKKLTADHPHIARSLHNLARLLRDQGKIEEAETLLREALETREKSLPANHPGIADTLFNLADLLEAKKNLEEAERAFRRALKIRSDALASGHIDLALVRHRIASLRVDRGDIAEAEQIYRVVLADLKLDSPQAERLAAAAHRELGRGYLSAGRFQEAEQELLQAQRGLAKHDGHFDAHQSCVALLEQLYLAWDKADSGKGYAAKAKEWAAQRSTTQPATTQSSGE